MLYRAIDLGSGVVVEANTSRKRIKQMLYQGAKWPTYTPKFTNFQLYKMKCGVWTPCGRPNVR
jgi:hypothetical protein